MRKCFLLLAFIAVCCTSCSKDIAEIGQICPPRGVHNATTYVFRGTETILWPEVRCPEEAPLCIQFSMDEVIRDTFYCHPDCEVGTKPCYGACIPVADVCITQETESKCKNGERPNGTCICPDYCPDGCDPFGRCLETVLPQDENHNHMDDRYETAINQGEDCRVYADCDTAAGANDGFCDSFIGYQCSTQCTSDDQCIDDGEYHYVCRGDGRCAPDEFVTVWKIPDNNTDLVLPNYKDKCAFEVDWGDSMNESVMCSHSDTVIRHTYKTGGTYTVRIKGTYDGYGDSYVCVLSGCDDPPESASKLIEVKSFGPVGLDRAAFAMCENLVSLSNVDIPDSTK